MLPTRTGDPDPNTNTTHHHHTRHRAATATTATAKQPKNQTTKRPPLTTIPQPIDPLICLAIPNLDRPSFDGHLGIAQGALTEAKGMIGSPYPDMQEEQSRLEHVAIAAANR